MTRIWLLLSSSPLHLWHLGTYLEHFLTCASDTYLMVLQLTVADKSAIKNFEVLLEKFHTDCAGGNYAEQMTKL